MIGPAELGTSRYAVGLAIPRPVARLQSRTPLRQARTLYPTGIQSIEGDHEQSEWNDGFVALKTGPGDRARVRVGGNATAKEKGRPGTRLRRIASVRKQTQVHRLQADTDRRLSPASPRRAGGPPVKPPV